MDDFYAWEAEKAFETLDSGEKGLSAAEARKRLAEYGFNELRKERKKHPIFIFLRQFENFLNILLIIAAVLSFAVGEVLDAAAMLAIVILSAVLGFFQEYHAEKAVEALRKISAPTARVLRDGVETRIPARELVPGDVLLLEAGDIVPADARLFETVSLDIEEAALTGESLPSRKVTEPFRFGTSVADQENMAFTGTIVVYGKGKGVVTSTGMSTELGKIAHSIQETQETITPLQKKFEEMAKQIGGVVLALCFIVFLAGIFTLQVSLNEMFLVSLSLAVAAVPSSLPAIVTISLGLGVSTLAKKNMIIKKLPAAEALGSVTVICSDKTGTITKNQMTVTKLFYDNEFIEVSGSGYEPKGDFTRGGKPVDARELEPVLRASVLCNNAKLAERNGWEIVGDPTEGALVVLGKKAGFDEDYFKKSFSHVQELPFDSERKMMTKIFSEKKTGKKIAFVKGAPDLLLKACDRIYENGKTKKLSLLQKKKILSAQEKMASEALRVLGIAYREIERGETKHSIKTVERNLVFLGLVGMMDPPRPEVRNAVEQCKRAGVKVIVISGDYATTTKAVAQQIGLLKENELVITGEELNKMSDAELEEKIGKIGIIARALPIQKSRIVDALKRRGHIVAMTGDGVNDAPALKKADIGISMGLSGTDVAREVSKATLADDNFATIVNAIEEGRNIYDKIIKSTRYLLSCNIGEIITVFLAVILKMPLPMRPLQILLMNLFTDGFPAMGLGMEPSEEEVMKRKPRHPKEPIISQRMAVLILLFGIIMGVGTLFLFNLYAHNDLRKAQTIAFTTLVMFEMFAVVGSRSLLPFRKLNPFTNLALTAGIALSVLGQLAIIYWTPLQSIFGTTALAASDWILILGVSSLGFVAMEASKFFTRSS